VSRFASVPTNLAGLLRLERQLHRDSRGSLSRLFCAEELGVFGWPGPVMQVNHTVTAACGTVRGLHYQRPPHTEYKLVSCLKGEIFDVAVDLRRGSPTFLQWHAERLSADNLRAMLIPAGFAHGFQTLSADCELIYVHSASYAPDAESGLEACDPRLAIPWPLAIHERSARDLSFPRLTPDFAGVMP